MTTTSDALPQILEGVPFVRGPSEVILTDRDFALNPTNCDPSSVAATSFGDEGAQKQLSNHFQVSACNELATGQASLSLTGGVNRQGHPAIHAA